MTATVLKLVSKKQQKLFELPEWVDPEAWNDYCEMRKAKKKPMLESTKERALQKLWQLKEQGQPVLLVINQSVDNGWIGFFPVSRSYLEGFMP